MHRNKSNHRDKKNTRGLTARRLAATAAMSVGLMAGGAGIASAASSTSTAPTTHASTARTTPAVADSADHAG
jgi:hypothetical protein